MAATDAVDPAPQDARIAAIATAIRNDQTLRLRARPADRLPLLPGSPASAPPGRAVAGPPLTTPVPLARWGEINIPRTPLPPETAPTVGTA